MLLATGVQHTLAQPRPYLRQPKRDFLTGRLVLIPANTTPDALAIPRQLAQIADHDVRTPPLGLLAPDQTAALNEWARNFDFAETDGLVVAADKLGQPANATLQAIRSRFRHLRIYGFGQSEIARAMLASGTLDFLLVTESSTSSEALASGLLLARVVNQRFGFAPPIATYLSSSSGRSFTSSIAATIAALGGNSVTANEPALNSGVRLIVHTPQSTEAERGLLISAIANFAAGGARIALVDASDNAEERAALARSLRERKLLDRLAGYASVSPQAPSVNEACQRALIQANLWVLALNFLRDDVERLRRIERAQIAALLNAYLRETVLLSQAVEITGTGEQREARALAALKPEAETLFNDQFKRNVHALLLNTGERAEFEIRLLQRLQVRWTDAATAPEIRTDVHLVLLGTMLATPGLPRAGWELDNAAALDQRVWQRFDAIPWQTFKTDAPSVVISIKLPKTTSLDSATAQGYSINSRRSRDTRRITVNAASPQAAFYSLAQLEQLGASGQLASDGQWTETPALAERGFQEGATSNWSHRDRLEILRWAGRARLTTFVYEPNPKDINAAQLRELNAIAKQHFVSLVLVITLDENSTKDADSAFAALTEQLKTFGKLGLERFVLKQAIDESLLRRTQQFLAANFPNANLAPMTRWQWLQCPSAPLQAWALAVPTPAEGNKILCVSDEPRSAVLPLAWFGAHTWSGKAANQTSIQSVTLSWLYDEKAREAINQWLDVFRSDSPTSRTGLAALFNVDATEVNAPLIVDNLSRLQATLPQFNTTRERGLLRGELFDFLKTAQQRLEKLKSDTRYERTETGVYRLKTN